MTNILSRQNWVLNVTNSNTIILETQNFWWISFCISKIYSNVWTFRKKMMTLIAEVFLKL